MRLQRHREHTLKALGRLVKALAAHSEPLSLAPVGKLLLGAGRRRLSISLAKAIRQGRGIDKENTLVGLQLLRLHYSEGNVCFPPLL